MLSTNGMHSQHTRSSASTHMCVDTVCRIARYFKRRSYFTSEDMSARANLCAMPNYIRLKHIRGFQSMNAHIGQCMNDSYLFEPDEKEVRNPAIAMAMRRIAMCEQSGTGMRMMREEWQKLGHPAPTYKNDRAWKAFDLFIPMLKYRLTDRGRQALANGGGGDE